MLFIQEPYHLQVNQDEYQCETTLFSTQYHFTGVDADGQYYALISDRPQLTTPAHVTISKVKQHD